MILKIRPSFLKVTEIAFIGGTQQEIHNSLNISLPIDYLGGAECIRSVYGGRSLEPDSISLTDSMSLKSSFNFQGALTFRYNPRAGAGGLREGQLKHKVNCVVGSAIHSLLSNLQFSSV